MGQQTLARERQDSVPEEPPTRRSWPRVVFGSGWWATLAVAVLLAAVLSIFGVPAAAIAVYAGYLLLAVTLPGTLLWRALRGTPRSFVEDVAVGTGLGYAVELLVYIGARAIDKPMWMLAWPIAVVVCFIAVPQLRRHWRTHAPPLPGSWGWAMSGIVAVALCFLAGSGFLTQALTGPQARRLYLDMPYQISLAAELKHHVPPESPQVAGEPLLYHWFTYAHAAASSWLTGLELNLIVLRLLPAATTVVVVVLTAVVAMRISGRIWAGPVAAFLVCLGSFSPFLWTRMPAGQPGLLIEPLWASPTQTFGTVLFMAALVPITGCLRGEGGRSRLGTGAAWAAVVVLLAAVAGAKATFLPLLLGGALLALAVMCVARRRAAFAALALAVVVAGWTVFAIEVLFRGASQALLVDPLATVTTFEMVGATKTGIERDGVLPAGYVAIVVGIALVSWLARGAGALAVLTGRGRRADPVGWLLAGVVIAGISATLIFTHPGGSQLYFLRSTIPVLAALSAWGAASLVPKERADRWLALALIAATGAGAWLVTTVAHGAPGPPTVDELGDEGAVIGDLLRPVLLIAVVVATIGLMLFFLGRGASWLRGVSAALVVAIVFGLGIPWPVARLDDFGRYLGEHGTETPFIVGAGPEVPPGGFSATRWLRANSGPDDIVATNAHCWWTVRGQCNSRHFWITAYAERRVLVEGWAYSATTLAEWRPDGPVFYYIPFDQPNRLFANDLAFIDPDDGRMALLHFGYHVRWLFVDETPDNVSPDIGRYATLRYRSGDCAVYELR